MTTFVEELFLVIMDWMDKTNDCVCCVVSLCETQCLYHVIFRKISLLNQSMLLLLKVLVSRQARCII